MIARGALAGLVGGLVFGAAMAPLGMLETVGSIIRVESTISGFAVNLVIAAVIGGVFGLLMNGQDPRARQTVLWGLVYGAFWWFLGPLTILPLMLGRPVAWDLGSAQALFPFLVGHLLYGAVTGLALAALMPAGPKFRQREGIGPAMICGVAYGFAAWLAVELILRPLVADGRLDWSPTYARAAAGALPAYLLGGAAALGAITLMRVLRRALFTDNIRLLREEGVGPRSVRATGHGALAGLVGGLVFTLVMLPLGLLPIIARLVGGDSTGVGLLVHLVIAQIIGVSYALLFRGRSFDHASALGWGVCYGFLWWILGGLTLLPLLLGAPPGWNVPAMVAAFPSLIGHLAYGGALGIVYYRLESRVSPWWISRNRLEESRTEQGRLQTLGSAPALWTVTVLIALTVPLLLSG
ncbi:hypothetical protein [Microtetraspora malaysiensis]|uniref:hypothetical protein n=1 Tax=Microtetraspora malaysiensis TaxID=161358 RepID=UPI003D931729